MAIAEKKRAQTNETLRLRSTFELLVPVYARTRVKPGDFFRAERANGALVLRPIDAIKPEDAWFWSPEWQAMEREADEDVRMGRVSGPFDTAGHFMHGLKNRRGLRR